MSLVRTVFGFGLGLLAGLTAYAAIGNVQVSGVTPTQAVISFTAPDGGPCSVKISETNDLGAGYRPVHDVNPALFAGADQDSRHGSIALGRARVLVAGKRTVEQAADGKRYSRALRNNTQHYFRIACGADAYSGSFSTTNIPFGGTYADPLPSDPNGSSGLYNYPSLDWSDRTERVIDPLTGMEIGKVAIPNDVSETAADRSVAACSGTNWINPGNCAAADGNLASHQGTNRDALYAPASFTSPNSTSIVNRLNVSMRASISGAPSGEDKYLDVCATKDGSTCASPWKAVDLTTCSLSAYQGECLNLGSAADMDFWGGEPFHGWVLSATEGFLLKPRTASASYSITIDHIRFTAKTASAAMTFPAHAGMPLCSTVPVTDDGDGHAYYLCHTIGSNRLYSIDVTAGRAYYLGPAYKATPGRPIVEIAWDQTNGRVFYAIQSTENLVLKGTWSSAAGAIRQEWTGALLAQPSNLTWTEMTLNSPGCALKNVLATFDSRYNAEWQSKTYKPAIVTTQSNKIVMYQAHAQDHAGWVIVYDPAASPPAGCSGNQGNVAAAMYVSQDAPAKYCMIHTLIGDNSVQPWIFIGNGRGGTGAGYFRGPWRVKVQKPGGGSLSTTDTVFEIQLTGGAYEPTDPDPSGNANDLTITAEAGDLFGYDANGDGYFNTSDEIMDVVAIDRGVTPPRWTMRRGDQMSGSPWMPTGYTAGNQRVFTISAGAAIEGLCRSYPINLSGVDNGTTVWNFQADPHARTVVQPAENGAGAYPPSPGVYTRDSGYASPIVYLRWNHGSHGHARIDQGFKLSFGGAPFCPSIKGKNACWAVQRGDNVNLLGNNPVQYVSGAFPSFAGKYPPGSAGATYQNHPGFLQSAAPASEKRWAFDLMPLTVGGAAYGSAAASPEPGATTVFKVTGTTLNRKHFGTLATCGERILRDISGPGSVIDDTKPYSYCVALNAGECRSGSTAGSVYVSCPGKTGSCAGDALTGYPATTVDVCVGDRWAWGFGPVQAPLWANSYFGERTRLLGHVFPIAHLQSRYAAAKALPSGDWAWTLANRHEWPGVYMFKVPPYPPEDSVNRGAFVSVPVSLKPPAGLGVNNAMIEFGYAENGAPGDFYCTTRKEACIVTASAVDPAAPFQYASESIPGVPCAGGCTIALPAVSKRVLYYRVKYRDAGATVLAASALQVVAVP